LWDSPKYRAHLEFLHPKYNDDSCDKGMITLPEYMLDLSNNEIGDEGVISLAEKLPL